MMSVVHLSSCALSSACDVAAVTADSSECVMRSGCLSHSLAIVSAFRVVADEASPCARAGGSRPQEGGVPKWGDERARCVVVVVGRAREKTTRGDLVVVLKLRCEIVGGGRGSKKQKRHIGK